MKGMVKILVLGSNGQVGQSLQEIARSFTDFEFVFWTRDDLDLSQLETIHETLSIVKPNYIINCAAYTAVDKAEKETELCFDINRKAAKKIAEYASEIKAVFIHYSSDYVYHNFRTIPLSESMDTSPKGVYAKSKLQGEQDILSTGVRGIILRTSWVYSPFGHNFLKTMLRLAESKTNLTIVADQIGAPTYAPDIAGCTMKMIESIHNNEATLDQSIILNYAAEGQLSWYDFAKEIFRISQVDMQLEKTTTAAYGAPAPRPLWSVLDMTKIKSIFGIAPRYWKDGVKDCINRLKLEE